MTISKFCLSGLPIVLLASTALPSYLAGQGAPIDATLARQYFHEAQNLCNQDGGKLWGVSLCGPIIFVDRQTRAVVANQADRESNLSLSGDVYVGKLPDKINIANTAVEWAGVKWTMVIWPLPEDVYARASLLAHELWHRIQNDIGLPGSMPANHHLDSRDGRIWLQLEWRALATALSHRGPRRLQAVQDALAFRAYRRKLFPQAAAEERALEMSEGLAEYTGVKLSGRPDRAAHAASLLREAEKRESFVRSFAYASGPAYGILLDEAGAKWRSGLKPDSDLGNLLRESLAVKLPEDIEEEAAKAARSYDGDALRAAESEREEKRRQLIAAYRSRLVEGPVLAIPLQQMSMQFNPGNLQPLDSLGTVYPDIRIVDLWGILTVTKGALMSPTFTKIQVPAPANPGARPVEGDGWKLELNAGWMIAPGERKGDYVIKKAE
ncbi:MAG TPA: hypothetical protein VNO70_26610 [Blastocatellia bacterium]|nr:hypothetical protein [Blastocatellia bacterium]